MSEQQADSKALDWATIGAALAAPFPAELVEWRVMGKGGKGVKAKVAAYIDARMVQERLDAVVGVGGWAFDWQPLNVNAAGDVTAAKGILTIHGISKSDVGTMSSYEPSKGAISDALKRAAVMWGIGRYLYALPDVWATLNDEGKVPEAKLKQLQDALKRRQQTRAA